MNCSGILVGLGSFLIVGALHPVVIKVEYYIGKKAWPVFLLAGVTCNTASLFIRQQVFSILMAVLGFSLFWSIHELFRQEKRVQRGWFPSNPAKHNDKKARRFTMEKILSLLLVVSLIFTLAACSNNADADGQESEPAEETVSPVADEPSAAPVESQPDGVSEPDDPEDEMDGTEAETELQQTATAAVDEQQTDDSAASGKTLVVYISHTGTTEAVAGHITDAIESDVFEIIPTNAYPSNYNEHLEVAQQELNDDVRPAIGSTVPNMADYDTILLGYPIWWGYAPRPVATFLESHDLSGKTIAPFCTSGSSGMGRSADEIAQLAPGAEVVSGLSITSSNTGSAQSLVSDWLSGLGLL